MKRPEKRTFKVSFTVIDINPVGDDRDLKAINEIIYQTFGDIEYAVIDLKVVEDQETEEGLTNG